jgi:hypothetical protein
MAARLPPIADEFDAYPPDAALSQEEEDPEGREWWTQLPDFIKPDYPLDLPPCRMPFARYLFTVVGAPRYCPQATCRRAGSCKGGDGPPCFRADRKNLWQVLFLWWMMIYGGCTNEQYEQSMRSKGNRYAPPEAPASRARRAGTRRTRRRSDAAKAGRLG